MTDGAKKFIHKNTFSALFGNAVFDNIFDEENIMRHIALARWADMIIIAPATADVMSKLAMGSSENLLLA